MRCALAATLLLSLVLTACQGDGPPPSVALITPTNDATVSGTAAIQVTLGEKDTNSEVRVYARLRDSTETGRLIGTVNTSPSIVSWNTTAMPNGDDLEIYASATRSNVTGTSAPVRVRVQNASAPTLAYLVAYNLPAGLTGLSVKAQLPAGVDPQAIRAGVGVTSTPEPQPSLKPQATDGRQLAVEWAWNPADGASGYRVLQASGSVAGPYEVVRSPAASAGSVALEKYSRLLSDVNVGDKIYGSVRSILGVGTESAMSNAGRAIFLDAQQVASPAQNQVVPDGRPILTWTALSGADGYLYFVCDRPCAENGSKRLWTNYPYTTSSRSAAFPSAQAALPKGTYHWWVAGTRSTGGKLVSLSYSESRQLVVP
ncbi:hypothetical protein E7T06_16100 [Deinococcus sp. Arct2-2]|uniref:Ig-like domain-containing protein n=1 Tax=Deinococcus sp. Arct2-2 TaxID=2568653 RepID=UPI0010A49F8F|nr:Ig-like domain-containing protein [Deinococcus sp. Arct2-2]THF68536.1 hypothetical protein E7T06_16100 [Deinococcus sp. Arct2-2]